MLDVTRNRTETPLPARILIVDDDPAIRSLLRIVIQRSGFDVDTASDGREALDLIREQRYAVAVVDLMMPRLNGYGLVAALADVPSRPAVIVATAMSDTFITGLDAAVVTSIIRKPFDVEMIAAIIADAAATVTNEEFALRLLSFRAAVDAAE